MEERWPSLASRTLAAPHSLSLSAAHRQQQQQQLLQGAASCCCPSRDLIALLPPLPSTASASASSSGSATTPVLSPAKISLARTTGNADTVWEWTPILPSPPSSAATTAPASALASKLAAFNSNSNKGKAKEDGIIEGIAWNPKGSHLAVAISTPHSSTLHIVATQSGSSVLPAIHIASSTTASTVASTSSSVSRPAAAPSSKPQTTWVGWHSLPDYSPDPLLYSYSQALIAKLPSLPRRANNLDAKSILTAVTANGGGPGAPGGGGAGMFGQAKQLQLQKVREKEASKALDLGVSAPGLPVLLADVIEPGMEGSTAAAEVEASLSNANGLSGIKGSAEGGTEQRGKNSILVVGDDQGGAAVYWEGTVFLGTIHTGLGRVIRGCSILPSTSPSSPPTNPFSYPSPSVTNLIFTTATSMEHSVLTAAQPHSQQISVIPAWLVFPPSLHVFAQQTSALQQALSHAFNALQEARVLWDESRRVGRAWLLKLTELSRSHGELHSPTSQLLLLLLNGRPSKPCHDFLASKMNERIFNNWESATSAALDKLKDVGFMSVVPAVERIVLLLEELRSWCDWPEKFATFQLSADWIDCSLTVCRLLLSQLSTLSASVIEVSSQYALFTHFLHYELEKLLVSEGSDIRPNARFQPIPVAAFLRSNLGVDTLARFLEFGGAQDDLATLKEVREAEEWWASLMAVEQRGGRKAAQAGEETLAATMKRMKEELTGQADAIGVGMPESMEAAGMPAGGWERPQAPASQSSLGGGSGNGAGPEVGGGNSAGERPKGTTKAPESIVVLLHLLATRVGSGLQTALGNVMSDHQVGDETKLGPLGGGGGGGGGSGSLSTVRERVIGEGTTAAHHLAWLAGTTFRLIRNGAEMASVRLAIQESTTSTMAVTVVDFDFFDDKELIFLVKGGGKTFLASAPVDAFGFQPLVPEDSIQTAPFLPITRRHQLDRHFDPQGLVLNGRDGRRVACLLSSEGRKLEVLNVDTSEDDEDKVAAAGENRMAEVDVDMR